MMSGGNQQYLLTLMDRSEYALWQWERGSVGDGRQGGRGSMGGEAMRPRPLQ